TSWASLNFWRWAVDMTAVVARFNEYWAATGRDPLRRHQVVENLADKARRGVFQDVLPLLVPGATYDAAAAQAWLSDTVVPLFPL
ncbi:MAG: hypothetical protein AAB295_02680, partial [Chloroflexota bacterium]